MQIGKRRNKIGSYLKWFVAYLNELGKRRMKIGNYLFRLGSYLLALGSYLFSILEDVARFVLPAPKATTAAPMQSG